MADKMRHHKAIIADEGFNLVSVRLGRKHHKVKIERGGLVFTLIVSLSPSDVRAINNFRADVRRLRRGNTKGIDITGQSALPSPQTAEEVT